MPKYEMTLNLQLLNHLGLNLYSNASAVISEAVANAWDADATTVRISIQDDKITIFDDGCGMDVIDINNKYLNVGRQRRNVDGSMTEKYSRPVMGRKGIGKLSLFSIADKITVYSVKGEEKNALSISTTDLRSCIERNCTYYPEELPIEEIDFENNGTKIVLQELKKKRTAALSTFLKRRIARRFSIIGDKYNFTVLVNDDPITIIDRNYLPKAQLVWIYPSNQDPMYSTDSIKDQCSPDLKASFIRPNQVAVGDEIAVVYGWIATASEPSKLQDEDESLNQITVMVRGKMAKEDILPSIHSTALYTKYVYGEIHADFLDRDDMEDIATSSRQDFFVDDDRYQALIQFLSDELAFVRAKWEEARSKAGLEDACKYGVVREWYKKLGADSKKAAQQLFGKINQLTVSQDQKLELFKHGIIAFETYRMRDELSNLEAVTADDMEGFLSVAGRLDAIEEKLYYQIIEERLAVIDRLKQVVDDNALEKVVQQHLANNLWLLDPAWDRSMEVPSVEISFRKLFDGVNAELTQEELDSRLDIKYKKASSTHVIIELKRSERVIKKEEAYKQISKYCDATEKLLAEMGDSSPFEIILLLGKPVAGMAIPSSAYTNFLESLKPYHCRIMYYKELLKNAESLYGEFLEAHEEASSLSRLIEEIS